MSYSFFDYLVSVDWGKIVFFLKVLSYAISAVLAVAIGYLILKINILGKTLRQAAEAVSGSPLPKRKIIKQWEDIQIKFERGDDANMKLAIIEADKLLDSVLERMGYGGTSMGEKLQKIKPEQFPRLDLLWEAHKVRNNIVHNPEYTFTRADAERTLEIFRSVLDDLGVYNV